MKLTMWGRWCLCTGVRRNEYGVQRRLDRKLWEQKRQESDYKQNTARRKKRYIIEGNRIQMNPQENAQHLPIELKLKRCGSSRPLGKRVLGWRSSSKKACAHASRGDSLVTGVYSSRREQRAMASGGVRGLKTWFDTKKEKNADKHFVLYRNFILEEDEAQVTPEYSVYRGYKDV